MKPLLVFPAIFVLVVGAVLSAESFLALTAYYHTPDLSDPDSNMHTCGLILGLVISVTGIVGVFKFSMEKGALSPPIVNPETRPWALRRIRNAIIVVGPLFLGLCGLPAAVIGYAWSDRVHWASVTVSSNESPRLERCIMNGKLKEFYISLYDFQVQRIKYISLDIQYAPPVAKTQTIWYNPLDPKHNKAGTRPPLISDHVPLFFALSIPGSLLAFIFFFMIPPLRANIVWNAAHLEHI